MVGKNPSALPAPKVKSGQPKGKPGLVELNWAGTRLRAYCGRVLRARSGWRFRVTRATMRLSAGLRDLQDGIGRDVHRAQGMASANSIAS